MRDLHKVREQEGVVLTTLQLYTLLGLLSVTMSLLFVFGYYIGRQNPNVLAEVGEDPLVPPDVQNESVAMLLARAAEDEAEDSEQGAVDLQFHDLLPNRTGAEAEAPRPQSLASAGKKEPATESDKSTAGKGDATAAGNSPDEAGHDVILSREADGGSTSNEAETSAPLTQVRVSGTTIIGQDSLKATPRSNVVESRTRPASSISAPSGASSATLVGSSNPTMPALTRAGGAGGSESAAARGGGATTIPSSAATRQTSSPLAASSSAKGAVKETERGMAKAPVEKSRTMDGPEPATEARTAGAVTPQEGRSAKTEMPKPEKSGGKGFTVQVSSYQESGVADKLVRQLMAQGFSAFKVAAEVNGHTWYRVRIGSFDSRDSAEREMQRLKAARSELTPMIAHR